MATPKQIPDVILHLANNILLSCGFQGKKLWEGLSLPEVLNKVLSFVSEGTVETLLITNISNAPTRTYNALGTTYKDRADNLNKMCTATTTT